MRFRRCPKCDRQQEIYVVICDCGYQFSDTDTVIGSSISEDPSTGSGRIVFGALVGGVVGAILGYLVRPAIPLVGQQLPFEAVITRGDSLRGLDQILVGLAQQSFNYLVFGSLISGAVGAVVGYFAKAGREATPAPGPANRIYTNAADQPQVPKAENKEDVSPERNQVHTVTVKLGQTPEMIEELLGRPEKIIELGSKTVRIFKDLKVTFVDGKVSDVQ